MASSAVYALIRITYLAVRGIHIISSSRIKPEHLVLLYTLTFARAFGIFCCFCFIWHYIPGKFVDYISHHVRSIMKIMWLSSWYHHTVQFFRQPGMGRPPALPSVVYVRVHHFRGRQFFTETSADVSGETIDLLNVVLTVPIEEQDEMGPAANSRGGVRARCR